MLPPLSLYIHFPWCVRKCPYCDFNSYTLHGELGEAQYLDALEQDLESQAPEVAGREVVSLFMGGGTPSLFSPDGIGRAIAIARRHLLLSPDVEVTMEANPGTIERKRFEGYRAAGVSRVSLGAQSFDSAQLAALGRIHSSDETRRAANELHGAGLSNFNLDLMYALPGQDVAGAIRDVEEALRLDPAHLSHYQLTIEAGTVFAGKPPQLPEDDVAAQMLADCRIRLAQEGFHQYEVSAYAREGRQCRHNLNYWQFGDYVGIGAGAHGKITYHGAAVPSDGGRGAPALQSTSEGPLTIVRTQQTREPRRYLADPVGQLVSKSIEARELPFEFMLNALRLVEGFEVRSFQERTGLEWSQIAPVVGQLQARGLLVQDGDVCQASPLGLRFLNDVLLRFLAETPKTTGSFGLSTTG